MRVGIDQFGDKEAAVKPNELCLGLFSGIQCSAKEGPMIKSVISDLGKVIIFFDNKIFFRKIGRYSSLSADRIEEKVRAHPEILREFDTGKITPERMKNLAEDDHRHNDPRFQEPQLSVNLKLVENLRSIAEKNGKTLAQLAIAWVLRRPEVTAAIVGARSPSQIEETVVAGDWNLSEEDIAAVEEFLEQRGKAIDLS